MAQSHPKLGRLEPFCGTYIQVTGKCQTKLQKMDITFFLTELKSKIGVDNPILKVQIIPDEEATVDNCFPNVLLKIEKDGGEIIYGWEIMLTNLLIEAQRHAIWKSPKGNLLDITPRNYVANDCAFVEDNSWTYKGQVSDNIRINITENPAVDHLILVAETITKLYQTGKRNEKGELVLINKIINVIKVLERMKTDLDIFLINGGKLDSTCFCCGIKKYKDCLGSTIKTDMEFIINSSLNLIKDYNSTSR